MAEFWPEILEIVKWNDTCPCWKLKCSYKGYRRHLEHNLMHWIACFKEQCIVHYDGKLEGGYFPMPP
jgi:hypothetical protein